MGDSLHIAIKTIEESLEEYSEVFIRLSRNNGSLALPDNFSAFLVGCGLPIWATYYHSQTTPSEISYANLINEEEASILVDEIANLSPAGTDSFYADLEEKLNLRWNALYQGELDFDSLDLQAILHNSDELPGAQHTQRLRTTYLLCTSYLLQVYNFIALVSFGHSMHDIVQSAQAGSDNAFFQAIEIDRTVIIANSYFQKRLIEIQLEGGGDVLTRLSGAMGINSLGMNYDYPELRLVFSLLHRTDFLSNMPMNDLLDLCLRLKVYKGDDVKALNNIKGEFLKSQPRPA